MEVKGSLIKRFEEDKGDKGSMAGLLTMLIGVALAFLFWNLTMNARHDKEDIFMACFIFDIIFCVIGGFAEIIVFLSGARKYLEIRTDGIVIRTKSKVLFNVVFSDMQMPKVDNNIFNTIVTVMDCYGANGKFIVRNQSAAIEICNDIKNAMGRKDV